MNSNDGTHLHSDFSLGLIRSSLLKVSGPKLYSKVLTIEPNRLLKILMAAKLICEFY